MYRGEIPASCPTTPLQCDAGTSYLEYDTAQHYYVVQFSDTHGNLSPFSAEVVARRAPGVPLPPAGDRPITRVYPNPFNPRTRVSFSLGAAGAVRIDLFAADGRFVRTLLDESRGAGRVRGRLGRHRRPGQPAASGAYYVRLLTGDGAHTRKLMLLK